MSTLMYGQDIFVSSLFSLFLFWHKHLLRFFVSFIEKNIGMIFYRSTFIFNGRRMIVKSLFIEFSWFTWNHAMALKKYNRVYRNALRYFSYNII